MSIKVPYFPDNIRCNKEYYFEVIDFHFNDKFQSVNIYKRDGTFYKADMITYNSLKKYTYQPQPDELAKFYLVKE